jgi:hypothetical protein
MICEKGNLTLQSSGKLRFNIDNAVILEENKHLGVFVFLKGA